jgi:transcriptional regulator with XRE-family HTH domain
MSATHQQDFKTVCRHWRQFRKLSQLDLALAANVSQRHVSWLETGRSRPSREMVLRLSEAMEVPLRARNTLLQAAGFSAAYQESGLDEATMAPVLDALNRVLEHHEPLPAIVVDRCWNVRRQNRASQRLLGALGDRTPLMKASGDMLNLALLTLHPDGLRRMISNWEQAAPAFVRRLQSEARAAGDPAVREQLQSYIELAGPVVDDAPLTDGLLPVLPLTLNLGGVTLSLFSVISTFGTPQDITTDELRIEAFFPADEATRQFFDSAPEPLARR